MSGRTSELFIVPTMRENEPKDPAEGRESQLEKPLEGTMPRTPSLDHVLPKLQRIAKMAMEAPQVAFTTLAHHIDVELLHAAYKRTRKDGAVGVDGQTAANFEQELESNLQSLVDRLKSGTYFAPPVRRVHIPKGDGRTRPIGIPTFEDKVLQRAVVMVLEAIYEQDFLACSYGFRPGRSAHDALEALWKGLMGLGGGWVVEVDIRSFFDDVDHGQLRSFLDQRVRDGVVRRAIDKWLNAGVLENGATHRVDAGTPQGGVISPLLANVYLHHVLDEWFECEVKPRLEGESFLVRYADDFVIGCANERDALRVMEVLPKRFGKYNLTLNAAKTKLVDFRQPPRGGGGHASFELLGFTHFWGTSRKGRPVVQRKTSPSRFRRALKRINEWCRHSRHRPVAEQYQVLSTKVRGHYGYFGITGNSRAIARFLHEVERLWRRWLDRRSSRAKMTWDRFRVLLHRYSLPQPRIVRSVYTLAANFSS
jgi:RNA-directed DNA polymerase